MDEITSIERIGEGEGEGEGNGEGKGEANVELRTTVGTKTAGAQG